MGVGARKIVISLLLLTGAFGYLGIVGVASDWVYAVDVDTFVRGAGAYADRRARVLGVVSSEQLEVQRGGMYASFLLDGGVSRLPVVYYGPIPELFQSGRQVFVEGRLDGSGVFVADGLLTKCSSRYQGKETGELPAGVCKPEPVP